jgi:hypothetical protein
MMCTTKWTVLLFVAVGLCEGLLPPRDANLHKLMSDRSTRTWAPKCSAGGRRLTAARPSLILNEQEQDEDGKAGGQPEMTKVGSKEYYRGFLETPVEVIRGDGIEQAVKLGLGAGGFLLVLTLAFLLGNGLIKI